MFMQRVSMVSRWRPGEEEREGITTLEKTEKSERKSGLRKRRNGDSLGRIIASHHLLLSRATRPISQRMAWDKEGKMAG